MDSNFAKVISRMNERRVPPWGSSNKDGYIFLTTYALISFSIYL